MAHESLFESEAQQEEYFAKLLEYVNSARTYVKYSGIHVTKLEPNYSEGELVLNPDVLNYRGIVHGGCLATLADTVAGIAAISSGRGTVTLNYGFNFLRPATGKIIKCVAEPERVGRTISVFRCSLTNDDGDMVASGQFTFFMSGNIVEDTLGK